MTTPRPRKHIVKKHMGVKHDSLFSHARIGTKVCIVVYVVIVIYVCLVAYVGVVVHVCLGVYVCLLIYVCLVAVESSKQESPVFQSDLNGKEENVLSEEYSRKQ